ncbi:MAG: GYD domain-containing protein [Gammaproteobacteria bacterium]
MKYILLGTISEQWAAKHAERVTRARAKLKELRITLESVYYTQGEFDFVDVVEAPDPEAALAFSLWYAKEGHGRLRTLPAFDSETMERATKKAKSAGSASPYGQARVRCSTPLRPSWEDVLSLDVCQIFRLKRTVEYAE